MMTQQMTILKRSAKPLALAAAILALVAAAGPAPGERRGTPGEFDFYVLALSWSPSFCAAAAERSPDRVPQQQCGGRPFSFVVHGLWPQFERGFPQHCQDPPPPLDPDIVSSVLDLMPARGLVNHEWETHGTCSGLSARDYFDTVRKARAAVAIPAEFENLKQYRMVAPQDVQEAFVTANAGATAAGITVTCSGRRLSEVRICLTKDLQFRPCESLRKAACRRDKVVVPPTRGG
jgi:ribonuclease T2